MHTVNNVANFNGQRPVIDPGDAVLLLIDHQSGLFQTVRRRAPAPVQFGTVVFFEARQWVP